MDRRTFLARIAVGAVPLAAGCAGGDGDGASPAGTPTESPSPAPTPMETATPPPTETPSSTPTESPSPTPTEPPTESPTATPTPEPPSARERYPDYEWGKLEGVDPTPTSTIEMSGFEFHPLVAAFTPGTEVTVTNRDSAGHTFTVPKLGIDETVGAGAESSTTITRTGTFDYVCGFHPPAMLGRLVVTNDPPTATPTGTPTETPTATPTQTPTETPTPTPTEDGGGGGGGY